MQGAQGLILACVGICQLLAFRGGGSRGSRHEGPEARQVLHMPLRALVLVVPSLIALHISAGARAVWASSFERTLKPFAIPSNEFATALAIGDAGILVGAFRDDGGAGAAYVFDFDAASITGTLRRKIPNPSPGAGDRFGFAVAVVGTDFVVGAPGQDGGKGVVYVFEAATGTLRYALLDPNREASEFGAALATAGASILVGAPGRDRAYLFDVASGQLKRTLSPPLSTGRFGAVVAADGSNLVIGAPDVEAGPTTDSRGEAYLFDGDSGDLVGTFRAPDSDPPTRFASTVAAVGTDVFVGAPAVDLDPFFTGAVYLFDGSTGTLRRTFFDPNPVPEFPSSVAALGTNVLVGSSFADSVYLFDAETGGLRQSFLNPNPGAKCTTFPPVGSFGRALATTASSFLTGAACDFAGRAYLFDATTGDLIQGFEQQRAGPFFGAAVATLASGIMLVGAPAVEPSGEVFAFDPLHSFPAPNVVFSPRAAGGQSFGISLSVEDAGDGVVVGAPGDMEGSGAAFLFTVLRGSDDGPPEADHKLTLDNPAPAAGDAFGTSVAFVGSRVIVGAPYDDLDDGTGGVADNAGAAYVFETTNGTLLFRLQKPLPAAGAFFGASVAALGSDVLVGSPFDEGGAGAVYLFDGATGQLLRAFLNPSAAAGDLFGAAVAAVGGNVVVGAPLADIGDAADAGVTYLFDGATGELLREFHKATPVAGDEFGFAVAALGADLLVGAPREEHDGDLAVDTGGAYVFDAMTGMQRDALRNPDGTSRDQAGFALAAVGNSVVLGAPRGSVAYVFRPCDGGCPASAPASPALVQRASPNVLACVAGYCDDGDPCTLDICKAGGCIFDQIASCQRRGCTDSTQCDDGKLCNGAEFCQSCDGCFLHQWSCCSLSSKCSPGRPAPNGTPCADRHGCVGGICTEIATSTTTVPPPSTTTSTLPRCTIDAGLMSPACAGEAIPASVKTKLNQAARLIDRAANSSAKQGPKLLKRAKKALRQAKARASRAAKGKKSKIDSNCAAALRDAADCVTAGLRV